MTDKKILGPWQYRRFMRWAGYFFRLVPWLWFGGIGAILAVSILGLDKRYGISMGVMCVFTVWPVIIGWLGINGFGVVWKFALVVFQAVHRKQRPQVFAVIWSILMLVVGVVFLGCAIMISAALLRHALTQ